MRRHFIYPVGGFLVTAALALALGWGSVPAGYRSRCDSVMLGSGLERRLEIDVPRSEIVAFNDRIVSYMRNSGYTFESSSNADYLSPPDSKGAQVRFLNIKTIGCTSDIIIWSENVIRQDQFIITVHSTIVGDRNAAARVASDLERLLSAPRDDGFR